MEPPQPDSPTEPKLSPAAGSFVIGMQRVAAWVSRHWLLVINGFFGLLLFGALMAPTMMAAGLEGPGRILYTPLHLCLPSTAGALPLSLWIEGVGGDLWDGASRGSGGGPYQPSHPAAICR